MKPTCPVIRNSLAFLTQKIMHHRAHILHSEMVKLEAIPNYCTALFTHTFTLSTRSLPLALTATFTASIALVSASSSTSACTTATSFTVVPGCLVSTRRPHLSRPIHVFWTHAYISALAQFQVYRCLLHQLCVETQFGWLIVTL
jgi:hypothetical protein